MEGEGEDGGPVESSGGEEEVARREGVERAVSDDGTVHRLHITLQLIHRLNTPFIRARAIKLRLRKTITPTHFLSHATRA